MQQYDLFNVTTRPERTQNNKPKVEKEINFKKVFALTIGGIIAVLVIGYFVYQYIERYSMPSKEFIIKMFEETDLSTHLNLSKMVELNKNLNTKSFEFDAEANVDTNIFDLNKALNQNGQNNPNNESNEPGESNGLNLKLKDFKLLFNGKVDNKTKASETHNTIKWETSNVSSWAAYENKDVMLLSAKEYFKENIGVNKDKKDNILKNLKGKTNAFNTYLNMLSTEDKNIFEEIDLVKNAVKKSFVKTIKDIPDEKFSIERNIPTTYKEKKVRADNYIFEIDKIMLDRLFKVIGDDLNTIFYLEASKFKSISGDKEKFLETLSTYKPKLEETESLKVTAYRVQNAPVKMLMEIKKKDGSLNKIAEFEFGFNEGSNNEFIAAIGTKIFKIKTLTDKGIVTQTLEMQVPKSEITNIFGKEIEVESTNVNGTEVIPANKNNLRTGREIPATPEINSSSMNEPQNNQSGAQPQNQNTSQQVNGVENANLNRALTDGNQGVNQNQTQETTNPVSNQTQETKPLTKDDAKIASVANEPKVSLKFEMSFPENVNASNMEINARVVSNIFNLNCKTNIKFTDLITIDIPTDNVIYLDKLKEDELIGLYNNVIIPTIVKVTANKINEIDKIKRSIQGGTSMQEATTTE